MTIYGASSQSTLTLADVERMLAQFKALETPQVVVVRSVRDLESKAEAHGVSGDPFCGIPVIQSEYMPPGVAVLIPRVRAFTLAQPAPLSWEPALVEISRWRRLRLRVQLAAWRARLWLLRELAALEDGREVSEWPRWWPR